MKNKTIQAILILLVILLGIFIGFNYEKNSSPIYQTPTTPMVMEMYKNKMIQTPKYLS